MIDTCTYVTAVICEVRGAVMTNSGKGAHLRPVHLGIDVAFGALPDCLAVRRLRPAGAEVVSVPEGRDPSRRRRPRPGRRARAVELLGRLRPAERPHRPLPPRLRPLAVRLGAGDGRQPPLLLRLRPRGGYPARDRARGDRAGGGGRDLARGGGGWQRSFMGRCARCCCGGRRTMRAVGGDGVRGRGSGGQGSDECGTGDDSPFDAAVRSS